MVLVGRKQNVNQSTNDTFLWLFLKLLERFFFLRWNKERTDLLRTIVGALQQLGWGITQSCASISGSCIKTHFCNKKETTMFTPPPPECPPRQRICTWTIRLVIELRRKYYESWKVIMACRKVESGKVHLHPQNFSCCAEAVIEDQLFIFSINT